jgi:Aerotolerance regulator N-terminal
MLFAFPYALLGAVALAGLVTVYTFRNRFRHRPVSSLMLWQQIARPRQGGTKRDTLQLPPLFYLELLILSALVLAAAAPHVQRSMIGSLTVVFDASVSMSARDPSGTTSQERAVKALQRELSRTQYARVRLLLAGAEGPEVLGSLSPQQAVARVAQVACLAPVDTLDLTLARAGEISDAADEILVLSDHPPRDTALRAGIRWQGCGEALPNLAITYADRSWRADGTEALLVEVASFLQKQDTVPLRVTQHLASGETHTAEHPVKISDKGTGRLVLTLPPGTPMLTIELASDALAADNRVILLPDVPRPVSVAVRVKDARLKQATERALIASGRILFDKDKPQLVFTDTQQEVKGAPFWQLVLTPPEQAKLLRGPYLLDHTQPLLEGVSFDGLVWAVGTNTLSGRALAFAGSIPLLTQDTQPRERPVFRLLSDGLSCTLFQSAAWPALVWNLLQSCAEAQPGSIKRNLRSGAQTVFSVAPGETQAVFETPAGKQTFKTRGGKMTWSPTVLGRYSLRQSTDEKAEFAVNLFAADESDLRICMSGSWGSKRTAAQLQRSHQSYAWLAGLIAFLLAGLHHWVLSRTKTREVQP